MMNEHHFSAQEDMDLQENFSQFTFDEILDEMEKIINREAELTAHKNFVQLKEIAQIHLQQEKQKALDEFLEEGNDEQNFNYQHPSQSRFNDICHVQKEKIEELQKRIEEEQSKNLQERREIIESLKNLYANTSSEVNFFKEIRIIKERWSQAGQVPKSEFKILNNDYFHHLTQFYQMLDLNKEYLEQEYAHNLEKRQQIIQRAKQLENEPSLQKALSELQYLHRIWREEAEPVAEEYRETTWTEFKQISDSLHEKKHALYAQTEAEKQANLEKKNAIIQEIRKLASVEDGGHGYWQKAIRQLNTLRNDFLAIGAVPSKISNQNWTDFREALKTFNTNRNNFYKGLKNRQKNNLEAKQSLVKQAQEHVEGDNWEVLLPLYKKLQEDWNNIGHVPKSFVNPLREQFQTACNTFFERYRKANRISSDNWKVNYENKKQLLEKLKSLSEGEQNKETLQKIKEDWEAMGKVPKSKIKINSEFARVFQEKAKQLGIDTPAQNEDPTQKARKLRTKILDLEGEITVLENNLQFFSDASRENPLLKDTYSKIDTKKKQMSEYKLELQTLLREIQ